MNRRAHKEPVNVLQFPSDAQKAPAKSLTVNVTDTMALVHEAYNTFERLSWEAVVDVLKELYGFGPKRLEAFEKAYKQKFNDKAEIECMRIQNKMKARKL